MFFWSYRTESEILKNKPECFQNPAMSVQCDSCNHVGFPVFRQCFTRIKLFFCIPLPKISAGAIYLTCSKCSSFFGYDDYSCCKNCKIVVFEPYNFCKECGNDLKDANVLYIYLLSYKETMLRKIKDTIQ